MRKNLGLKTALVLVVVGLAIVAAYPPQTKIKPGLDLKGGIHLVLQVLTDDAVNSEADQEALRLQEQLKKKPIEFKTVTRGKVGQVVVQGFNTDKEGQFRDLLDEFFKEWDYTIVGADAQLTMKANVLVYLRDLAVNQALETIRNRVDQFGVSEPTIQRQGLRGERIIVELAGITDPDRIKDILRMTALLEWKLVKAGPAPDEASLLQPFGGTAPDDATVVRGDPKRTNGEYYLVDKVATVTGRDLRLVRRSVDEWNNPSVAFQLHPEGGRRFEQATSANIGKQMAIVLDGRIQSSPVIETVIPAESGGIIRGRFTIEEVEDLVIVLKAGALPAGIKYLEERTIGPSLGADSIRAGLMASLVALLLVMAFMIVYYKLSGVNAVVALFLNIILLGGALAWFKANLTLPGIAGIILTIGMAVDANVLIFERIKEELRAGKSTLSAISAGFSKAFSAIFDSNITTIISAVFLFQFGTGPIKGYAVTLIIGITASMFTAIFVSHLIFDLTRSTGRKDRTLSI